jgi:phage shock protein PspC (stress-responsive transcriptional regulator)
MTINPEFRTESAYNAANNGAGNAPHNPLPSASRRMVYRHPTDHSLGGVCAGLADYVGWDPVLVRALWVMAFFVTSGSAFLVYLLLWLLLPVGTQAGGRVRPGALNFGQIGGSRLATVLLVVGGLWLLSNLGVLPALTAFAGNFLRIFFWPLLLIGAGYWLLKGRSPGLRTRFDAMRSSVDTNVRAAGESVRGSVAQMPLRRSRSDRMVLGLCGGLSARLGIDANLIRLAWVILSLGTLGLGVLLYIGMALFVPEEGSHWAPDIDRMAEANGHVGDFEDVPVAQAAPIARLSPVAPAAQAAPQSTAANDVSPIGNEVVHF